MLFYRATVWKLNKQVNNNILFFFISILDRQQQHAELYLKLETFELRYHLSPNNSQHYI